MGLSFRNRSPGAASAPTKKILIVLAIIMWMLVLANATSKID